MVAFLFDVALRPLLTLTHRDGVIDYALDRQASVKDAAEALGVPHTEIARLRINGAERDFAYLLVEGDRVEVQGIADPSDLLHPSLLRPPLPRPLRFLVDVNVGKLAGLLRLLGLDTEYRPDLTDAELASISRQEGRILLSRDKTLLKRKIVQLGRLIRAANPRAQLEEVAYLFGLAGEAKPFSRCLRCNIPLTPVAKEEVLPRLEPLTRKYYDSFSICRECRRIYWPGSHHEKMKELLKALGLGNGI